MSRAPALVRVALLALVALVLLVVPGSARAQGAEVSGSLDAPEVELGDVVTYTLQASTTNGAAIADPKLSVPGGLTLVDSGQSPSHMVSIVNGRMTEKQGLNVSWVLRADRLGTFTIGPATIQVGGAKRSAPAQRLSVVAPGSGHRRRRPNPFDPFGSGFDPFKGLFPQLGDDDEQAAPFGGIATDPKLGLAAARAPTAFLHATVDKTRAVIGEQVTLTVYLYEDLQARQGRVADVHEATATDFVKRSLLQDETRATHVGNAMLGGRPWAVKLVRKNALFPIKAGKLEIGPMSLTLAQVRSGLRESEPLVVEVGEPPVAGRPPGYQLGDTGDFSLAATVNPRTTTQHGAIGVSIELRGTGNLPATLPLPEIAGVEWLEPTTHDALGAQSTERFGGTRTFDYVVRVHKAGAVDLGELRLPFWNPDRRAYDVARAALGIVTVGAAAPGNDAGAAASDPTAELLPGLPAARTALEGPHVESYIAERPLFWAGLFGTPLTAGLAIVLGGALREARRRRAEARPSPERIAKDRRAEADSALRGSDGPAAVSAVARGLEADVLARTGVNVRGTAREAALRELEDAGIASGAAQELLATLAACEDARFSPAGVTVDDARALKTRADRALAEMAKA